MNPVRAVNGKVAVLDRADVDTDQIIPKQFLKRIERTGFGEFLFYDWVRSGEFTLEPAPILVAGRNFGCGSSREHAVWAIQQFGYQAVVAPSIADIFYNNATKNGLLPVALPDEDVRALMTAGEATIDLGAQTVTFTTTRRSGGAERRTASFDIDPEIKHRLLNGLDDIAMTLGDAKGIDDYESSRAWPAPATTSL